MNMETPEAEDEPMFDQAGRRIPKLADNDPIVLRRQKVGVAATLGRKVGYALFGMGIVIFLYGFFVEFANWVAVTIVTCLILGSILLIPSIIFGYAVKAADRHDRGLDSGH